MWRIRIDTALGYLALEVRDADLLLSSYYTLHTSTFELVRLAVPASKAWWEGLEDTQNGYVLLHGYGDKKVGEHKGILAYKASNGEMAWEQPDLSFYGIAANGVLAYNTGAPEGRYTVLHNTTGQAEAIGLSQKEAIQIVEAFSFKRYETCVYPSKYVEGEEYFGQVRDFLIGSAGAKPVKSIEYAETVTSVVISYYEVATTGDLVNFLAVFDLEGNLLLKEKLGSRLSGIGSDTFFIFNLNLYFLQDKHTLQVYRLLD